MTTNEAIAKRISDLWQERNMTLSELCKRSGVTKSTIHRIISGDSKNVLLYTIEKICIVFGINLADFFVNDTFTSINK